MSPHIQVAIEPDAIPALARFVQDQGLARLALIADDNTYRVLGRRVEQQLTSQGCDVKTVRLAGAEITPDEDFCMQVFAAMGDDARTYLAVGSGVITDITRFVSHRSRNPFISLPTAPSVDAYTSTGSSLVLRRFKQTIYGQPPIAVFADLNTLCASPRPMIAAGFGDVVAKFTSVADWKLSRVLWNGAYSEPIAQRMALARDRCMEEVDQVGAADREGVRSLIVALIEAGLCMLDFGGSQPAGQSEHYISHYLEMKLVREGRPPVLHGAKTGMATVIIARYYAQIRAMARDEAARRLHAARRPDRQQEIDRIRSAYGPLTEMLIVEQAPFLDWTDDDYEQLKQRILDRWSDVQAVAAEVPSPAELTDLLQRAGGTADYRVLGLGDEEVSIAEEYGHYVRNRFTIMKLSRVLGLLP